MAHVVGGFIGGLLGCTLLSIMWWRLLKGFVESVGPRLILTQLLSLATTTVLGGYGYAEKNAPPVFLDAFLSFAPAQVVVAIIMAIWLRKHFQSM